MGKHDKAYQKGYEAGKQGLHKSINPYKFKSDGSGAWAAWRRGWVDAQIDLRTKVSKEVE